jgi:hypothetical protein
MIVSLKILCLVKITYAAMLTDNHRKLVIMVIGFFTDHLLFECIPMLWDLFSLFQKHFQNNILSVSAIRRLDQILHSKEPQMKGSVDTKNCEDQTWKKFLAFWASELGDQNPSADFLQNTRYKEGITKICNH